jgi:hypothetical protein
MPKRKVEVFTSGCPICEPTVDLVKDLACTSCEVIIYDLNKDTNKEIQNKATSYGIERIPAVAVNGKLLECCAMGSVSEDSLRHAGVGSA